MAPCSAQFFNAAGVKVFPVADGVPSQAVPPSGRSRRMISDAEPQISPVVSIFSETIRLAK